MNTISLRGLCFAAGLALVLQLGLAAEELQIAAQAKKPFADVPASHQQTGAVSVTSSDGKYKLQTVGIDADGRVLALTSAPKSFGAPLKGVTGEVHVFTPEGKPVTTLKVDFHANSVAGGPDGHIFIAGEGKVARFTKDGKLVSTIDLPHIAHLLKDKDGLRKQAEEQIKRQMESMQAIVKTYRERVKALEDKKPEDRSALEKRQLEQYLLILKQYEQPRDGKIDNARIEAMMAQATGRLRTVNSMAFSAKDIFIACGDTKGFGYAVWRMDHAFKNPTQVLSGLGGCCGQMDVQTAGADLLVAENTKHGFARYDRDGKPVGAWGKRSQGADIDCFGGCCNPMNLRAVSTGDIFTAESEGVIKRFSAKGDFLGLVATTSMTGAGCKNVAFAVSRDESKIYFLDLNGSRFLILTKK